MKKISKIILIMIIALIAISCKEKENYNKINIMVPSGTPLISIAGLLDNELYNVEIVSGADLLTSAFTSKSHDVIIAPINVGTKLFINKGSNYKMDSIVTFGNTYIISQKDKNLNNVNDLEGKEIIAFGNNSTPGLILDSALKYSSVTSTITYQNAVSDVVPLFVAKQYDYALVAEPALTQLKEKFNLEINVLDLQEVLKEKISFIPQAAIFINPDSININTINKFVNDVKNNISNLNNKTNEYLEEIFTLKEITNTSTVASKYFNSLTKNVLQKSIPNSNINYKKAKEAISILDKYYDILNDYNNKILGGKKPDESFYN